MSNPNHDERGRFAVGDTVKVKGSEWGRYSAHTGVIQKMTYNPAMYPHGMAAVKNIKTGEVRMIPGHKMTKIDTSPSGQAKARLQAFHKKMQDPAYHAAREAKVKEMLANKDEIKLKTRQDAAAIGKLRKIRAAAGKSTDYGSLNRALKRSKKN